MQRARISPRNPRQLSSIRSVHSPITHERHPLVTQGIPSLPDRMQRNGNGAGSLLARFMRTSVIPRFRRLNSRLPARRNSYNGDVHLEAYRPEVSTYSGRRRNGIREPSIPVIPAPSTFGELWVDSFLSHQKHRFRRKLFAMIFPRCTYRPTRYSLSGETGFPRLHLWWRAVN